MRSIVFLCKGLATWSVAACEPTMPGVARLLGEVHDLREAILLSETTRALLQIQLWVTLPKRMTHQALVEPASVRGLHWHRGSH